jgi:ankyrin repeat protein
MLLAMAGCDTTAMTSTKNQTGLMLAISFYTNMNAYACFSSLLDSRVATVARRDALVDWLVGEGGEHLDVRDTAGSSAFAYACLSGRLRWVEALVSAGCDTSAVDDDGKTGIMLSMRAGWTRTGSAAIPWTTIDALKSSDEIVERLLRWNLASVTPWSQESHKRFPPHFRQLTLQLLLCWQRMKLPTEALIQCFILPFSTIYVETGIRTEGRAQLEARSYQKSLRPDVQTPDRTAFLKACQRGHIACANLLVLAGCDMTATDALGKTGLMLAASNGHADMLQKLLQLQAGGSIEITVPVCPLEAGDYLGDRDEGFRAFHYACLNGHVGCVDALLRNGCDITAIAGQLTRNESLVWNGTSGRMGGTTGLMMAISKGNTGMVTRLLQQPGVADLLEVVSGHSMYIHGGGTPFLRACEMANVGLLQLLVNAGCDTTAISPVLSYSDGPAGSYTGLHAVIMHAKQNRKLQRMAVQIKTIRDTEPWIRDADPVKALVWLLKQDGVAQMLEVQDTAGRTALECAIEKGETECVALLVQAGCNRLETRVTALEAGSCGAT